MSDAREVMLHFDTHNQNSSYFRIGEAVPLCHFSALSHSLTGRLIVDPRSNASCRGITPSTHASMRRGLPRCLNT
jgi:hypothetical protein